MFDHDVFEIDEHGAEDLYTLTVEAEAAPSGERALMPAELVAGRPGLLLAAVLASIDVASLTGHERIRVLQAHQRMASHYLARVYDDMAAVPDYLAKADDGSPSWADEAAAAEIRVALRLTRRAADAELVFALDLKRRLPCVWDALVAGSIDVRRARTIVHGTAHLSLGVARRVADHVVHEASRWTTGQLAARLRRACIEADPDEAADRYRSAVADRRVVSEPTTDGAANLLGLELPPHRVAAATRHINHLARSLCVPDETRTMDQLRADVFLDLVSGGAIGTSGGGHGRGVVDIHVDLATLAELDERPGEVGGYGPVIADIARHVAAEQQDAEWRYTVTHPETGRVLTRGTTRRRPTSGQRRTVESIDPTCVFPGCRMPAASCDLDHRVRYADGGPTTAENLVPLCRHDHSVRHRHQWRHEPLPSGDHLWTSALGHAYTTSGRSP